MTREFVIIPSFMQKWKELGLNDEDMRRLEQDLLSNPKVGKVMKGTGKVRKMRFAFENKGKSGSTRVIYVDFEVYKQLFLIDIYQKSNKDNLTAEERNSLRQVVEILESKLGRNFNG